MTFVHLYFEARYHRFVSISPLSYRAAIRYQRAPALYFRGQIGACPHLHRVAISLRIATSFLAFAFSPEGLYAGHQVGDAGTKNNYRRMTMTTACLLSRTFVVKMAATNGPTGMVNTRQIFVSQIARAPQNSSG